MRDAPKQLTFDLPLDPRFGREDFLVSPANERAYGLIERWPDWTWIAVTVGVFFLGQFLEGNIVSPMLVGASVGLHPVWLMFALLAFGSLFGFTGLIVAVPVAAAIGVLLRFATRRYRASPLYLGQDFGGPVVESTLRLEDRPLGS